jgi:hypothetical protein
VRYSELDGEGVLYEPTRRAVHRLSPAAAAVWLRFDGRPLAPPEAGEAAIAPSIEVARRLRTLGLAEDAPVGEAGADEMVYGIGLAPAGEADGSHRSGGSADDTDAGIIRLPGRLADHDGTRVLVLEAGDDSASVDLDRVTLVPTSGGEPVAAVLVTDQAEDPARTLGGIDALRALVEHLPPEWFASDDSLDRLADLVDAVPVTLGRAPPA